MLPYQKVGPSKLTSMAECVNATHRGTENQTHLLSAGRQCWGPWSPCRSEPFTSSTMAPRGSFLRPSFPASVLLHLALTHELPPRSYQSLGCTLFSSSSVKVWACSADLALQFILRRCQNWWNLSQNHYLWPHIVKMTDAISCYLWQRPFGNLTVFMNSYWEPRHHEQKRFVAGALCWSTVAHTGSQTKLLINRPAHMTSRVQQVLRVWPCFIVSFFPHEQTQTSNERIGQQAVVECNQVYFTLCTVLRHKVEVLVLHLSISFKQFLDFRVKMLYFFTPLHLSYSFSYFTNLRFCKQNK